VILVTRVPFNRFHVPSGLPRPFFVQMPALTKEELAENVAKHLMQKEEDSQKMQEVFYENFAKMLLSECHLIIKAN